MKNLECIDELAKSAKAGDRDALEELACAIYPLAFDIAKGYAMKIYGGEVFLEDYISEAMSGMLSSLSSFDADKGKFLPYCSYAMRESIRLFITFKQRLIAQPKNVTEKIAKLNRAREANAELDDEALARKCGFSIKIMEKVKNYASREGVLSLDEELESEECSSYLDLVSSEDNVEELVIRKCEIYSVRRAFMEIPEDDRTIVLSYFGAFGYEKLSINDIADKLGLSPQNVIYRKKQAIKRVRNLAIA